MFLLPLYPISVVVAAHPTAVNERWASDISVATCNGTLRGYHSSDYDQDFFLNIPYAEPPLGELRFRGPVPYNSTYDDRDATQYGASCYNYQANSPIGATFSNYSEDCLTLNIVRPAGAENLPVAVWIHGGGFLFDSGIDQKYNMSFLVQQSTTIGHPMIGITINYRLGPFGFLASEEILEQKAGNAGLRDQRQALQWVAENIQAFGGDPNKVTIMGESAGATSVGYQILAFAGENARLFRSAIMESGNPINPTKINNLTLYQPIYELLLKRLNYSESFPSAQLSFLRSLPSQVLSTIFATAPFNTTFQPMIDGDFLPMYPSAALKEGSFAKVPIIDGTNMDEGTLFTPSFAPRGVHNDSDFVRLINITGNFDAATIQRITELYPDVSALGSPYNTGNDSTVFPDALGAQFKRAASYVGDFMFNANRRKVAQVWSANNLKAYCYRFNALTTALLPNLLYGVYHTTEIAFVLHNLNGVGYTKDPFVNQSMALADLAEVMSNNWIRFIATGDPNDPQNPSWPAYNLTSSDIMFQPSGSYAEVDDWRAEQLEYINSMPGNYMR